jgi:glycosyltransferase involved in cell wall biosynthesis
VDTPAARETVGSAAALVPSDAEAMASAMDAPVPVPDSARNELAARFSKEAAAASLWSAYERML